MTTFRRKASKAWPSGQQDTVELSIEHRVASRVYAIRKIKDLKKCWINYDITDATAAKVYGTTLRSSLIGTIFSLFLVLFQSITAIFFPQTRKKSYIEKCSSWTGARGNFVKMPNLGVEGEKIWHEIFECFIWWFAMFSGSYQAEIDHLWVRQLW